MERPTLLFRRRHAMQAVLTHRRLVLSTKESVFLARALVGELGVEGSSEVWGSLLTSSSRSIVIVAAVGTRLWDQRGWIGRVGNGVGQAAEMICAGCISRMDVWSVCGGGGDG